MFIRSNPLYAFDASFVSVPLQFVWTALFKQYASYDLYFCSLFLSIINKSMTSYTHIIINVKYEIIILITIFFH